MSLKKRLDRLEAFTTRSDDSSAAGPLSIEDYLMKPPAALIGTSYAMLRDAGELLPALLSKPARTARSVILLLSGIDAASAAGLWQITAAPLELNRLAQQITADDLAIWQTEQDGNPLPAWAAERLDAPDIGALLATAWDRPFGELETMRDALQRLDRETQGESWQD